MSTFASLQVMIVDDHLNDFVFRRHDISVHASVRCHRSVRAVVSLTLSLLLELKGPFLTFTPWVSMFADWRTRQTIIHSRKAVYVMPPLIEGNGKLLSIAELIASGHASFSSHDARTSGNIDMARFFHTNPCLFFALHFLQPLSDSMLVTGPRVPTIDSRSGGFRGGVRTNYDSFPRSRYCRMVADMEDDDESYERPRSRPKVRYSSNVYLDLQRYVYWSLTILPLDSKKASNVTTWVPVPVDEWQPIDSNASMSRDKIRLILVAQHDEEQEQRLKDLAARVSDLESAEFQNFLTHEEIYQKCLPKTTNNGRVLEQWAKANGITVSTVTRCKQFLKVEARVATMERAFRTKFNGYEHIATGKPVMRVTRFQLPSHIHDRLAYIDGLSTFPNIRTKALTTGKSVTQSPNAPIFHYLDSGFGHHSFHIQLVCQDGQKALDPSCKGQFTGFQITVRNRAGTYRVSVKQANCQICSVASPIIQIVCDTFNLNQNEVWCQFFLNQTNSIGFFEPHDFAVQTIFGQSYSDKVEYRSTVEKIFDITPSTLRALYNVDDSTTAQRHKASRQAIAGFDQYLNIASFRAFSGVHGKDFKHSFGKVYGGNYNDTNKLEFETSLDIQYMAAMGSGIPMDYISSPGDYDGFLIDFFVQVILLQEDKSNVVPLVYSISYGFDEDPVFTSLISVYEAQLAIMSVEGKTVFASSGDDGSAGTGGACRRKSVPSYPGSSAYVTSVGATEFLKATTGCARRFNGTCLEEVVATYSLRTGCRITSGGGFSWIVESPKYQQRAVNTYLNRSRKLLPPKTFFNQSKRAYPDLTATGHQYHTKVFGDSDVFLDGTSASSPALAGLVSLIVDRRLKLGKKPLGLLNKLLYQLATTNPAIFYDIVKGSTNCNSSPNCCQYGFSAAPGWDPASGLGSIDHTKLMNALILV